MQTITERVIEAQELAEAGNFSVIETQKILAYVIGHLVTINDRAIDHAIQALSYSELEAIKALMGRLDGYSGLIVASSIADEVGISRSIFVTAVRKLESAGLLESRSLGMRGTMIKVLVPSLKSRLLAG